MTPGIEMTRFFIRQLSVLRFGPFEEFSASLRPGTNVFLGPNASGKTQLVGACLFGLLSKRSSGVRLNDVATESSEVLIDVQYGDVIIRVHTIATPRPGKSPSITRELQCSQPGNDSVRAFEQVLATQDPIVLGEFETHRKIDDRTLEAAAELLMSIDPKGHWGEMLRDRPKSVLSYASAGSSRVLELAAVVLRVEQGSFSGPVFIDNMYGFVGYSGEWVVSALLDRLTKHVQLILMDVIERFTGGAEPIHLSPTRMRRDVSAASFDSFALSRSASSSRVVTKESKRAWLAVATEWFSRQGGISTLNRRLCIALAAAGERVVCFVPDADESEIEHARKFKVNLVVAPQERGGHPFERLRRRPGISPGFKPTIILGHGRVTGPAARSLAEDHFPAARRLHMVHMASDELEWYKSDRLESAATRAEERRAIELELGRSAYRIVAIGPRLANRFQRDLGRTTETVVRLDPGVDSSNHSIRPPGGSPHVILAFGRMEDIEIKRPDLAARAAAIARRRGHRVELVVRGVPANASADERARLLSEGGDPALPIVVRSYTSDTERLASDLESASVVLMPSRVEGFGLVALEAIEAGVPIRISDCSGLGELLQELLSPEMASRYVIPVTGINEVDAEAWSRAIETALHDREAEFAAAAALRSLLAGKVSWSNAVVRLLEAVE